MKRDRKILNFKTKMYRHDITSKTLTYSLRTFGFGPSQLRIVLDSIYTGALWGKDVIFDKLLPSSYEVLRKVEPSYIGKSLITELELNFAVIEKFPTVITSFLKLRDKYEHQLLTGLYDEALSTIEEIEKNICVSVWTLENRFLVLELKDGVEANKYFLNSINNTDPEIMLSFLAEFYSFKSEKGILAQQYYNRVNRFLDTNAQFSISMSYFKFKLLTQFPELTEVDCLNVLHCETNSSIIDRYLTVVRICQLICSGYVTIDQKVEITTLLKRNILRLHSCIEDPFLERIINFLEPDRVLEVSDFGRCLLSVCDLYTRGEYVAAFNLCKELITDNANCFELYELYAKSSMFSAMDINQTDEPLSLHNELLKLMMGHYTKDPTKLSLQTDTSNLSLLLAHLAIGQKITNFLEEQTVANRDIRLSRLNELTSQFTNPRFSLVYHNKVDSLRFLTSAFAEDSSNSAVMLYKVMCSSEYAELTATIPSHRLLRYVAASQSNNGQYEQASQFLQGILTNRAQKLPTGAQRYLYEKVTVALYIIQSSYGNLRECLKLYVDNYLYDQIIVTRMDIGKLVSQLNVGRKRELNGDINLPILYYLYYKTAYNNVYRSYANFLDAHQLRRPTELIEKQLEFSEDKLIFFLKNICSLEVMQSSLAFDNPEDVRKERISICQHLIKLDRNNEYDYIKEIGQITHKLRINTRAKQIDQSRIDVDVKGIKEDPNNMFPETFNRYRRLRDVRYVQFIDINDALTLDMESILKTIQSFTLKTPRFVLFREILVELRDQFAFNQKFGLNSSLSTRVRHGALLGQLRAPFELNQIILSKKDASTSKYELNKYWLERLRSPDQNNLNILEDVRKCLEELSSKIDGQIELINDSWMRINTESKQNSGLFNFTLTEDILLDYFKSMQNIEDPYEFFDSVMSAMWDLTRISLVEIREKLTGELNTLFLASLNDLDDALRELDKKYSDEVARRVLIEIKSKITNCRTEAQNQIVQIVEWFKLSENKDYSDFDAQVLVDTCIETNRSVNPAYSAIEIVPMIKCESTFAGSTYTYLTDILNILLQNAVKHSMFDDPKDLHIDINVTDNDEHIVFTIINNLSGHVSTQELQVRIDEISRKLGDDIYVLQNNAIEGESGYAKISKILKYNIRNDYQMNISMPDDQSYQVLLKLSKNRLIRVVEAQNVEHSLR